MHHVEMHYRQKLWVLSPILILIAVRVKSFWLFPLRFYAKTLSSSEKAVKAIMKRSTARFKITEIQSNNPGSGMVCLSESQRGPKI